MKRKLSLLMVLMMVLTLIPAMPSFAATDNRVTRVVSVTSDGTTGNVGDASIPKLIIKNDEGDLVDGQKFRLELASGASWSSAYDVAVNVAGADATAIAISERILEVDIVNAAGIDDGTANPISIDLAVDFDGAPEGAQKVTVNPRNSAVTGGEYTYATIGAGKITATVDTKVKISRGGSNNDVSIILDEVSNDSFKAGDVYTLRLPKNFSWGTVTSPTVAGVVGAVAATANDGRDLVITLADPLPGSSATSLESIIVDAEVKASRDANYGDITVSVAKGNVSPSSFVIGEYVDYTATVKVDKVLDVVSGRHEDGLYVAKLKVEENAAGSLIEGRYIEFSFDKEVAALQDDEEIKITKETSILDVEIDDSSSKALTGGSGDSVTIETNDEEASHEWDVLVDTGTSTSSKGTFEMEIPFVVSALHEGDVELTVKGAGIEEQKVVIAKATKPVTVEIDKNSSADLKIGVQKQAAPDIIITETKAGALGEFSYEITSTSDYTINWADAKIEVIEGDLELDTKATDIKSNDKGLDIVVDNASTKASKIKISGVLITLDRTVPYGPFNVDFKFGNVVPAHDNLNNRVERKAYFNVVTPAPGDQNATTSFTMDSTTYTMIINGQPQTMTMDVAPFIQDNRAMLPIKYVADAIGAKVNYDPMSRVATFTKDATVAALYLDSNVLYVNGTPVTMDTKPVISNGRAMVPVIYVAQAFGFQYGTDLVYDAATRTVTIFPAK